MADYKRMVHHVDHVGVTVGDLDRSVAFYRDLLDLEVVGHGEGDPPWLGTSLGAPGAKLRTANLRGRGVNLELIQYVAASGHTEAPSNQDVGATHLCFAVDDIEQTYAELSANGYQFSGPVGPPRIGHERPWGFAYLVDPDGISIEFLQTTSSTSSEESPEIA